MPDSRAAQIHALVEAANAEMVNAQVQMAAVRQKVADVQTEFAIAHEALLHAWQSYHAAAPDKLELPILITEQIRTNLDENAFRMTTADNDMQENWTRAQQAQEAASAYAAGV